MNTSLAVRLIAGSAAAVTTPIVLDAVVSLAEPATEGAGRQLAAVVAPVAR